MFLAQGPQHSDAGEARPAASRSRVKHSTTALTRGYAFYEVNLKTMKPNTYDNMYT